jgi:CubicO group peptidase (beta-lactamase class C family)
MKSSLLNRFAPIFLSVLALCQPAMAAAPAAKPQPWKTATPEAVGMNSARLDALAQDIRGGKYADIHGLLVVRHGKLAFEQYFTGDDDRRGQQLGKVKFDANTLHDLRSITKSVTSILFGIALADKRLMGVDTVAMDYFSEDADLRTPERTQIRLRDLLSMTSGLQWDEDTFPYGNALNSETAMDNAPDPFRYVWSQPMASAPGTTFRYSGGDTMLLASVIERATGMRLDQYANWVLFGELGITQFEWLKSPGGMPIAASGLRLLPRDIAKVGQLYLDHGRWNGKQIVPEAWVKESLTVQANVSPRPFGLQNYGYQWWLGTARVGDTGVPFVSGVGYGGQRLLIVPSMDLVAVLTTGNYRNPKQGDIAFEILLDRVLPAVTGK